MNAVSSIQDNLMNLRINPRFDKIFYFLADLT